MIVNIINKSSNALPEYETPSSAGLDVRCTEKIVLNPGERILAKTGLFVEIPIGYEIQVRPRSGLALKQGITKVFIDNTFTLGWELTPYFKLAAEFDYMLYVITVEKYHDNKNVHDISQEQLEKMAEKYKVKLL